GHRNRTNLNPVTGEHGHGSHLLRREVADCRGRVGNLGARWACRWMVCVATVATAESQPAPQRLTSNPTENPVSASAISPDGKYLAYSDNTGTFLRLISTGETHALLPKD